jgi:hypothetical protein
MKSALFRAAPGGWVFRSPNPWVFGDTPHYLVNDSQKAQIEAIIAPRRPGVVAAVLIAGVLAWVLLVATFMRALSGHGNPTTADISVMVVLIVLPLIALLPIAGLIQRRRLRPVLAGAALKLSGFRMPKCSRTCERLRLSGNRSKHLWPRSLHASSHLSRC